MPRHSLRTRLGTESRPFPEMPHSLGRALESTLFVHKANEEAPGPRWGPGELGVGCRYHRGPGTPTSLTLRCPLLHEVFLASVSCSLTLDTTAYGLIGPLLHRFQGQRDF